MSTISSVVKMQNKLSCKKWGCLLLLLGGSFIPVWAQVLPLTASFERIGKEELGARINCILQDQYGFIWIGTQNGLVKYDGYHYTTYQLDPSDTNSISHNNITTLLEDRQGILWVGTNGGGLNRFDPRTSQFKRYHPDPGRPGQTLSSEFVSVLYEGQDGMLWVGTIGGGLNQLDPASDQFVVYKADPELEGPKLSHANVHAIYEDPSGRLWLGTGVPALNLLDPQSQTIVAYDLGPEHGSVQTIRPIGDTLWLGLFDKDPEVGGLYVFDVKQKEATRFNPERAPDLSSVSYLETGYDRVWIGTTENGLHTFDPIKNAFQSFSQEGIAEDQLSDQNIQHILVDTAGFVWIGTFLGGLNKLNVHQYQFGRTLLDATALGVDLQELGIYAMLETDKTLWAGTLKGLVHMTPAGQVLAHYKADSGPVRLPNERIFAITLGMNGYLWLGTGEGLVRFNPETEEVRTYLPPRRPDESLDTSLILAVKQGADGYIWCATNGAGLVQFDPINEVFIHHRYRQERDLGRNYMVTLDIDEKGTIWAAGNNGLNTYDPTTETLSPYHPAGQILDDYVLTLYRTADDILWLGTYGTGLVAIDLDQETIRRYARSQGLPGNTITGFLPEDEQALWVSTFGNGLARLDLATEEIWRFDQHHGALDLVNQNAAYMGQSGWFYWGGVGAFNRFRPSSIEWVARPRLILTSGDGLSITEDRLLDKDNLGNMLPIKITVLEHTNPAQNQCSYQLDDGPWVNCVGGQGTFVSLGNINGEHTLHVRAQSSNGMQQSATYTLVIPTPWWEVWYVRLLGGVLLFGGVWGLFYWMDQRRLYRQKQRVEALQEARQKERNQLASWVHDVPLADLVGTRFELEELYALSPTPEARQSIEMVQHTLAKVRKELRSVCGELQLPSFEYGLEFALRTHMDVFQSAHPQLQVSLEYTPPNEALAPQVCQHLFLIYRTAMNNVVKHAQATRVVVRVQQQNDIFILEIEDNGKGFVPPDQLMQLRNQQNYGLLLADVHARALGGRFEVDAAPGKGTRLRVKVNEARLRP